MGEKLINIDGSINIKNLDTCLERCLIKTINVVSYMSEIRDPYTLLEIDHAGEGRMD